MLMLHIILHILLVSASQPRDYSIHHTSSNKYLLSVLVVPSCESLTLNGTRYCEWGYNGLGIDYQVLAGPAFMAVFTVVGVILGVVADK